MWGRANRCCGINGTIGFVKLGEELGGSPKALMRMFSAKGNPQARNLFEIVADLQNVEGTVLEVVERAVRLRDASVLSLSSC